MSEFYPNQKVVCIRAEWGKKQSSYQIRPCPINRDQIYTVRGIGFVDGVDPDGVSATIPTLYLVELQNVCPFKGIDVGFSPKRFRPLEKRKTSIKIFTDMLKDTEQGVSV